MSMKESRQFVQDAFKRQTEAFDKMNKAFENVRAALDEQRDVVANWRKQNDNLSTAMSDLRDGHLRLHATMGTINVAGIRDKSLELVEIMERYENGPSFQRQIKRVA